MATVGMMNEAYFTGRKEIVAWIQGKYQPSVQRIEDLHTGAVYCQIIDSIYPGTVQLSKVKFSAKQEHEILHNFKILQAAFAKNKLDRHIEVEKLSKKNSFQMNLEFIQWMKILHDQQVGTGATDYNAEERMKQAGVKPMEASKLGGAPRRSAPAVSAAKKENVQPARASVAGQGHTSTSKAAPLEPSAREKELELEVTDLKLTVDGLEKERDFYFGKLRDIEILCQTHEDQNMPFLRNVLDILYQTEDDFVTPSDAIATEGEAVEA